MLRGAWQCVQAKKKDPSSRGRMILTSSPSFLGKSRSGAVHFAQEGLLHPERRHPASAEVQNVGAGREEVDDVQAGRAGVEAPEDGVGAAADLSRLADDDVRRLVVVDGSQVLVSLEAEGPAIQSD